MDEPNPDTLALTDSTVRKDYIGGLIKSLHQKNPDGKSIRVSYDPEIVDKFITDDSADPNNWGLVDQLTEGFSPRNGWPILQGTEILVNAATVLAQNEEVPSEQANPRLRTLMERGFDSLDIPNLEKTARRENKVYDSGKRRVLMGALSELAEKLDSRLYPPAQSNSATSPSNISQFVPKAPSK